MSIPLYYPNNNPDNTESRTYLKHLCERWDIPFFDTPPDSNNPFYLTYHEDKLQLIDNSSNAPGPLYVDFIAGKSAHRRRFGGGKNQLITKAVGLNKGFKGHILDATAGLGRDAFVLASFGCQMTLLERNPIVAALLDDGLKRATQDQETAEIIQRVRLIPQDSLDYLEQTDKEFFDIIYLDPMFPDKKGSALVKKEMQYLQQVVGKDRDSDQLLQLAIDGSQYRVVVKRPKSAPYLGQITPQLELNSKGQRLDIYIKQKLPI